MIKFQRIFIVAIITGCAFKDKEFKPIVVDYSCHFLRPIYLSNKDSLTESTRNQIVDYNQTIEKVCPDF